MMRRRIAVAIAAFSIATLVGVCTPPSRYGPRVAQRLIRLELFELAYLAGVRNRQGELGQPLPIEIIQEGGPLWLNPVIEETVSDDPAWAPGKGGSLLRFEVVSEASRYAVKTSLYRHGWSLQMPTPFRLHLAAWVGLLSAALGGVVAAAVGRMSFGCVTAGILAQVFVWLPAWPEPPGRPGWNAWGRGPLGMAVQQWAVRLSDQAVALAAGLVTLCAILIAFDHRRSPGRGGALIGAGLAMLLGTLAWLEGALRSGLIGFATSPEGTVACLSLFGGWVALIGRKGTFAR